MARPGITQDDVFTTATALEEEGTSPTVNAVRERLGTGSFSTITNHLEAWRLQRTHNPLNVPVMPERVERAFHQAWSVAARTAWEGLEEERETLRRKATESESNQRDMTAEIERLEQLVDEADRKTKAADAERGALNKTLLERDEALSRLKIEAARMEERLQAAQQRGEEIKVQLEQLQQEFSETSKTLREILAERTKKP